jgi:hypothetical protein
MATAHMNVKGRTSLDGSGWAAGLRKMEVGTKGAAGRMRSSMAGALGSVFAIGFLTSATRRILQHADQIDKTAKRISTSTDTVQKFDFAATQSGAALTDVEKAFINTSKAIEGAKQGLTTQMRAFQAFGISLQMLQTMSPEQVFLKIAEAIEKAGDAMDRAKSLEDIMGRGGKVLIPAFKGGFAGLMGQAPKGIDSETVKNLAEFNDELDRLKREALPAAADAVGLLADAFKETVKKPDGTRRTETDRNLILLQKVLKTAAGPLGLIGQGGLKPRAVREPSKEEQELQQFFENQPINKFLAQRAKESFTSKLLGINEFPMLGPLREEQPPAAAGAKSFMKPSLALNALQRIGAAVSQSADPIAIEKDNNTLLKRIANNTKDIARNSE